MRIISWNVNGIRSIYKKLGIKWLADFNADVICLQEIKANENQLTFELLNPLGYFSYFNSAKRGGYSGTAIYSKIKPKRVNRKLKLDRFDKEGRVLDISLRNLQVINLYIPHGGRQKENLKYKLDVYEHLFKTAHKLKDKNTILVGDFNIAHKEIDLARPRQNKNNIMFTSEEREQIDRLIKLGFVDSFRAFNKSGGNYTWWPYFANARDRNLGWRIDYVFVSKPLLKRLKGAFILKDIGGSDHCPIGIEID